MRKILFAFLMLLMLRTVESRQMSEKKQLDSKQKQAIVTEVNQLLDKFYVYPESAQKMENLISTKLKNGEYDRLNDAAVFAHALADDLRSVSKDKHLNFNYNPELAAGVRRLNDQNEDEKKKAQDSSLADAKRDNFGFRKVERLSGNIGYLDFRYFASAADAGPTAQSALAFLANCDAIIIDLRQNGGGDPTQVQFISSYFFKEPTHLNDIYTRSEDLTENFWTLPYVPGPKLENADLYILTSKRTFSGAEEFCYNMKNLKRATLIGETTGGGAHPTDQKVAQNDFVLAVPVARAINPISKTNWEGTGVTPDISVPSDQALDKAYELALKTLAGKTKDAARKSEIEWTLLSQQAKTNPVHVDESILSSYAGTYEDRHITFENGTLYYQRSGPKYKLRALTQTTFEGEGLDDFRLQFVVENGKTVQVNGIYSDGSVEPSKRTD